MYDLEAKERKSVDSDKNMEHMAKRKTNLPCSDIMSTNCYCQIHFKLNDYSISNLDIDKKSLLFYPKISPRIDIRRQFVSYEYKIWNSLSFINYDINIPEKSDISLLKINIDNKTNK
jgi:hypothetical protein